ncbi:MAG: DUF4199 domain-containing protein [Verrucomicrobia bacterium]|nr:DUF4199 domain-containing protein [Verrucomicrobiota bacterium]
MKTSLTYGAAMAIGGALLVLGLYFFGFHSEIAKLGAAQWIGTCGGLAVSFACLYLGLKARRAEVPPTEEFGYGRALGNGVMIVLFGSLFSTVTNFIYFQFINPGFADLIIRAQSLKMEEKGMPGAQIEQMEKMMQFMLRPGMQTVSGFFGGMIMGTILALIAAALVKRAAAEPPVGIS